MRHSRSSLALATTLLLACGSKGDPGGSSAASSSAPEALAPGSPAPRSGLRLTLSITPQGFALQTSRGVLAPGCTTIGAVPTVPLAPGGGQDFAALHRCLRALRDHMGAEPSEEMTVFAQADTPYKDLLAALDAAREDGRGEIFPEFHLGAAPEWGKRPATCGPITGAPAAVGGLLTHDNEEGIIVRLSKTQITVGEEAEPCATYANLGAEGLPLRYKAGGQQGLFIEPLAAQLRPYREADKKAKRAAGKDDSSSDLILVADETTPYRALMEVLLTAGACEVGRYHLLVRTGAPAK